MSGENSSGSPWYVRSFGELYPLVYRHRDDAGAREEIGRLFALLGLAGDERTLDLCCGAGRHTWVVRELGCDVTGLDLSPELLAEAAGRPGLRGRLVRGDMRRLPFPDGGVSAGFDLLFNLFTSFGYFEEESENEAVLFEMARVLKPGGRVVIDHINRARLERTLVPSNGEEREGLRFEYARRIEGDRVIKDTTVTDASGGVRRFRESVRIFRFDEIAALLEKQGFSGVRAIGSFAGAPFDADAERMIVIATLGDRPRRGAR